MKSASQVLYIEDCFETLDEAKEEIRRLNKNRAFLRESIASMQAETTRLAEALKEAEASVRWALAERDRAEAEKKTSYDYFKKRDDEREEWMEHCCRQELKRALDKSPAPISGAKKE